jgi:hypothetical protein
MLRKNQVLFGLFSLASFDFFLLGIQVISKEVSKNVSWIVFGFFVIVLVIQLAVLAVVARLTDNEGIKAAVGGLMLAGNIIAFYVAFYDKFLTFHKAQLLLAGLALAVVSALALYFVRRIPLLLKVLFLALVVNSLYTLVSVISYNPNKGVTNPNEVLAKYQNIKLKSKPNIHLIAFDSLQPGAVVEKHMGLKNLPYVTYLQQNSTIIKNLFATGSPTKNSFNSQLRLADGRLRGDGYFAGRIESPVVNVLHANGYKLETGFSEDYFGAKGPYVDDYIRLHSEDSVNDSTLCGLSTRKEKILKLYGFCLLYSRFIKQPEATHANDWHQKVFDIISNKAHAGSPWMTINYIYNPIGHTPVTMDGHDKVTIKKYIAVYERKSKNDVPTILSKLIDTIKKNDPNSIVLIFGDHGPILSRAIPIEENPEFNVPDRFAVFGAIYKGNNPCSNINNIDYYRQSYTTLERVVAGIFRCLAVDPTTVDKAVDFQEPYPFGKYLYDKN